MFLISWKRGLGDDYIALRRSQNWISLNTAQSKAFIISPKSIKPPITEKIVIKVYADGRIYKTRIGPVEGICHHCHKPFVKVQRLKDPPSKNCPTCAPIVRRLTARKASMIFAANAAKRRGEVV